MEAAKEATMTASAFMQAYGEKVAAGELRGDPAQESVAQHLESLTHALQHSATKNGGILGKFFRKPVTVPKGLYIHGEVGRGKTMLMDLFFSNLAIVEKRRVHFHAFMQEVHGERTRLMGENVIARIADHLARNARLLCLDEMQIADIADAMIIGRLYEALLACGVTLVTTSNATPEGLYKDGLNRALFLPFIAKLRDTMDVVELPSSTDYRLGRVRAKEIFLSPATAENRVAFNNLWRDLTDGASGESETLEILGRKRVVPKVAHSCAAFTFFELCGEALGPPDYLAIAKAYRTVFISGVPKLKPSQRNEAKRFILMIDTFYDAGTRIVVLAEGPPEELFPKGHHALESRRTVSRLKEMQSVSWWGASIVET
jgi:cell division protein ZapE